MHRLNIFLSHFGHSGWVGLLFFGRKMVLTLTLGKDMRMEEHIIISATLVDTTLYTLFSLYS